MDHERTLHGQIAQFYDGEEEQAKNYLILWKKFFLRSVNSDEKYVCNEKFFQTESGDSEKPFKWMKMVFSLAKRPASEIFLSAKDIKFIEDTKMFREMLKL